MTARAEAVRTVQRLQQIQSDIKANDTSLSHLVAQSLVTGLTSETGIGPVTATTVLVTWCLSSQIAK